MAEPRERPLNELLSRDMVDIYVGPENTHWILHEKLLCHRSRFFRNIFYNKTGSKNHTYGLPDEDDEAFKMFVGWLYSESVPTPKEEKDLTPLFDLYLMGEKWEIKKLILDCLEQARRWYHDTDTWPGLRRVQYVYANTEIESPMRQLLVQCVARMLVLGDGIPQHWEKALRRNGQLAVDVILCVQKWHAIDGDSIPDAREESVAPIVEEAEERKVEIKKEEQDDEPMTNGVDYGDEEEEAEEGGEEEQEEEQQQEE